MSFVCYGSLAINDRSVETREESEVAPHFRDKYQTGTINDNHRENSQLLTEFKLKLWFLSVLDI